MFGIKTAIKNFIGKRRASYIYAMEVKASVEHMLSEKGSMLDRQGFVQGTDKSSVMVSNFKLQGGNDILRHYDFVFNAFRADNFSLLEFGCFEGGSLKTWEQYFPNASIYGVDLDESAKRHEKGRIHVVIGDAASQDTYDRIKAEIGSAFIILDDASHAWSDQRRSFELFWDMVAPGGFYVIEDLGCGTEGAYPQYPPKILDAQPFFNYLLDRCDIMRWSLNSVPENNSYHFEHLPERVQKIEREMDMCIFVHSAVMIRKKP